MLQVALDKKPTAIGFAALDSQASIPLLQKAKDEGIPIIAFDSGVDSDIPVSLVTRTTLPQQVWPQIKWLSYRWRRRSRSNRSRSDQPYRHRPP